MHKNDNIPEKMWFSLNDIKSIAKSYGKELTVKKILEQAVLYTTKKKNPGMKFDSPERIRIFLHINDTLSAAVTHDADGEQKHLGTITFDGLMPLSDCYVQELLDQDSTNIQSFTFEKTGTGIDKEIWPKYHSNEPPEIAYADFCIIDPKDTLHLNKSSISNLYVYRSDAVKLFKKYREMAKKAGFKRVRPVIDTASLKNLVPLAATDDELTAPNTPALGLPYPNDVSKNEPIDSSELLQATNTLSSNPPPGHPAEDYTEFYKWLWETWTNHGEPAMKKFFPKLKDYIGKKGSPITGFVDAGKDAGIKYELSGGETGERTKCTLRNQISKFKRDNRSYLAKKSLTTKS